MKNKIGSKKSKPSEKTIKKRQLKKLKKDSELKKRIVTVAKSIKNERSKEGKLVAQVKEEEVDSKDNVKPPAIFNEDGKMVFSRFEFASRASQAKKSKKDSKILWIVYYLCWYCQTHSLFCYILESVKNPKVILRAINKQKKQIDELLEQGDTAKVEKIKEDEAWKKAFDKTAGKTVKDNTTLLHKAIHKKVVRKKKSKLEWKERTAGVEKDKAQRQKKRNENIQKKQSEKKKNKLKKMSKMGRIIPGY